MLCIDTDAPTDASTVGRSDLAIPVEQPRTEFVHWVMVDIPAATRAIAAGECSDGVTPRGKAQPRGPRGARQGLNDYTGWFAGDADMAGQYHGYDGPYPPPTTCACTGISSGCSRWISNACRSPMRFTAADVWHAMNGHVLAEAAVWGRYSLNPDVAG